MTDIQPKPRLRGKERLAFANELKTRYRSGASVQQLADETGRTEQNVRDLLALARTRMRPPARPVKPRPKARVVVKRASFREPGPQPAPTGPLNKMRLAEAVATDLGIDIQQGARAVDAVLDAIARTNAAGHDVTVTNFGTFRAVTDRARKARNPQTGDVVQLPARQTVRFRVSPRLAEIVRAGDISGSIAKRPSK